MTELNGRYMIVEKTRYNDEAKPEGRWWEVLIETPRWWGKPKWKAAYEKLWSSGGDFKSTIEFKSKAHALDYIKRVGVQKQKPRTAVVNKSWEYNTWEDLKETQND